MPIRCVARGNNPGRLLTVVLVTLFAAVSCSDADPQPAGGGHAAADRPLVETGPPTVASGPAVEKSPAVEGDPVVESDPAVERGPAVERDPAVDKQTAAYGASGKTDPVRENGPIFAGWTTPQAALLISGEQFGFLEPCGCAGLENQKGGLMRRHTLIQQLSSEGWPLVAMDLGGQVKRFGPQAEIKFRRSIESLHQIGYRAVAFGPQDLRLPAELLLSVAANLPADQLPFVAANVGLFALDSEFVARTRVVQAGDRRIGITSILGKSYQAQLNNDDIKLRDPEVALTEVVGKLREEADFLILLSHATVEESTELAKQFPQFDIVVTAGGADVPPNEPKPIEGTTARLVEVGHKGMYVIVLGLYDDPAAAIRYQRVPLDARFDDSPEMHAMMVDYQRELETLGLDGLGLAGVAHPSGRKFVGSRECAECHIEATEVWKDMDKNTHSHATETLVDLTPPRHFDPECLSCHVTGWEPQEYFPYSSGFTGLKATGHLTSNGCENCHGPGSAHVAAQRGDVDVDDETLERLQQEMRLTLVEGEAEGEVVGAVTKKCLECHDLDNSPDFVFKEYWPRVEHHGTE